MFRLFLIFLFNFSILCYSQEYEWSISMGANISDVGRDVCVDVNGNSWVVGSFYGTVDFNTGTGTNNLSATHFDAFILKSNAAGDFIWVGKIGGINDDFIFGICTDSDGNIYIAGHVQTSADLDPGSGSYPYNCSANDQDIFIEKLDNNGNVIWIKTIGGLGDDHGNSIALDGDGNVLVTGGFEETVDFDPGAGVFNLTGEGYAEAYILKLDNDGNFIWAKSFGGTVGDAGYSIHADSDNNILATGYFMDTCDFDTGTGIDIQIATGDWDIFTIKLNSNGDFIWARTFGGSSLDAGEDVSTDSDNNVYTVGRFQNSADIDPGSGIQTLYSIGGLDGFVQKLDENGNFVWAFRMGSSYFDLYENIVIDQEDNIFLSGEYAFTVDFDPGPGILFHTSTPAEWDIFVQKITTDADLCWVRTVGGVEREYSWGLAIGANKEIYTTGTFQSSVDFDPGAGVANHNAVGTSQDIFIWKLSGECALEAALTLNGNDFSAMPENATYQWINCKDNSIVPGETASIFEASESGEYAVIITSECCVDTSECINFSNVSVPDITTNTFLIFPNPSTGIVYLEFESNESINAEITITDVSGHLLLQEVIGQKHAFDLTYLAGGIYFFNVITENGITSTRFIVE